MASRPAPNRQFEKTFPTPLIGDVLFKERTVCQSRNVPAYGTAHPNTQRWPDHKLVFVSERAEPDSQDTYDFFYAADRDSQDLYNFSFTKADIGQTKFDSVTRTYIRPRSSFAPAAPVMGTAMPNVPENLFTGAYVLANHREIRIEQQELDSLYVAEEMTWVKRVSISEVTLDTQTGNSKRAITTLYYKGEDVPGTGNPLLKIETLAADPTLAFWGLQPTGVFRELQQLSDNWFAIIESVAFAASLPYDASNPARQRVFSRVSPLPDLMFYEVGIMPDPIPAYDSAHYTLTDFKLAFIEPADKTGFLYTFHYAKARTGQDAYNWEYSTVNIGGIPAKAVRRTYVVLRSVFDPTAPAPLATMPNVPANKFPGTYVLFDREQQRTNDPKIDPLFVIDVLTYVLSEAVTGQQFDPGGAIIDSSSSLVAAASTADAEFNVAQSDVKGIGNGTAAKSTQRPRRRKTDGITEEGWPKKQKKSKGNESLTPQKFRKQITQSRTTTQVSLDAAAVDNIPAPATPTGTQTLIEHEKVNDYRYEKRVTTEVIDPNADPLEGEATGTWGIETTTESLVNESTPAQFGFGVKSSQVSPIGNGNAIEVTQNYPAPSAANIIYELEGQEHDELTGAIIDTYKVLCNAGSAKALATTRRGLDEYVEIKSLDKWHSIMVAAKVNGTIDTQTWKESRNINLPDVLTEVGIIWDANSDSNEGASGVHNRPTIVEKDYTWNVSAEAAISGSVMGRPYHLMKNGFKGSAEVTVVRTFHYGPPNGAILAEAFNPVYGTLTLHGASTSTTAQSSAQGVGGTKISSGGRVRYSHNDQLVIQQIGPVVHSGITLTNKGDPQVLSESVTAIGGSVPGGGLYPATVASINIAGEASLDMPASSIPKSSGDTYILHVDVRPWRLGWWIREVYTAKVP